MVVFIARCCHNSILSAIQGDPLTVGGKLIVAICTEVFIGIIRRVIHIVNARLDPVIVRKYIVRSREILRAVVNGIADCIESAQIQCGVQI